MSRVMKLDINADVVFLFACSTGRGRVVSGEGVMNMGRAFQLAGARTVFVTMWDVNLQAGVELVKAFFYYLKEGKGKLEALKLARQHLRSSNYFYAPHFWAPYVLVGEPN